MGTIWLGRKRTYAFQLFGLGVMRQCGMQTLFRMIIYSIERKNKKIVLRLSESPIQRHQVRQIMRKISSWWNIDYSDVNSYEEWRVWLVSIRIQSNLKGVLEGVYYGLWWYMWNFRKKLLFDKKIPKKAL
ncbi:hypothetical protein Tco_1453727, partial [Tanacetum coccineum]